MTGLPRRTHTPDRTDPVTGLTTFHVQRHCNGCDAELGNADDRDVDDHGRLTDVRGECPNCRPHVHPEAAQ